MVSLEKLKRKLLNSKKPIFYIRKKQQRVIFPSKFGQRWVKKAKWSDIDRVSVS